MEVIANLYHRFPDPHGDVLLMVRKMVINPSGRGEENKKLTLLSVVGVKVMKKPCLSHFIKRDA